MASETTQENDPTVLWGATMDMPGRRRFPASLLFLLLLLLLAPLPGPSTAATFADAGAPPLTDSGDGTGVAWGDYDNDGDPDLYITNATPPAEPNKLFRNDDGIFVDVTHGPLGDTSSSQTAAWGDYDGDEDLDLYLANANAANKLLRNVGGTFVDATHGPLGDAGDGRGVAWADYDGDGQLDLYLSNSFSANKLFRNVGGVFTDETPAVLADTGGGRAVAWSDYDGDGDPDLYLANTWPSNKLFRNDGGTFADVTSGPEGDTGSSYGAAWGDYDNDGDPDLYVTNSGPNKLLRNDGSAFVDVTSGPLGDSQFGRGVSWGDYDLDGDLDLYFVNGGGGQSNRLLRNDAGTFVDVTAGVLGDMGLGQGTAWADYDDDGDLDLYLAKLDVANALLRNDTLTGNNWLQVDLNGSVSPRTGWGSSIRLVAGGQVQTRQVLFNAGYLSQKPMMVTFGLGLASQVDSLVVTWPSGIVQWETNVAVNQRLFLEEEVFFQTEVPVGPASSNASWADYDGDGDLDVYLNRTSTDRLCRNDLGFFTDVTAGTPFGGLRSSTAVWGDYDVDGDLDVFLAFRLDGLSELFRNDGGSFVSAASLLPPQPRSTTGASWIDLDGDRDLDLYLVNFASGEASQMLRNDGTAFVDVAVGLELVNTSAGSAAWVDYDDDGDMDVYRHAGDSHELMRNDGGVFSNVLSTQLVAGGAAWGDYDNDGDLDLVRGRADEQTSLLRNDGGVLTDVTPASVDSAIPDALAWVDFDNDGDLDLHIADSLLENVGGGDFVEVPLQFEIGPGVWADADRDGDVDPLFPVHGLSGSVLVLNQAKPENHWLHVNPIGTQSNTSAIGARIEILAGGIRQIREIVSESISRGPHSLLVEFGLGAAATVDSLLIRWPSGVVQVKTDLSADQVLHVREPGEFADVTTPLMAGTSPSGVAWVDYDGDGDLDLHRAASGDILRNESGVLDVSVPVGGSGFYAAWGDYDGDGDPDVLSTGASQRNQLLRNDSGTFVDVTPSPLDFIGVSAAWGDYDLDGDLDLFAAASQNRLLRNDGGGAFADVTTGVLQTLVGGRAGVWGDYDGDYDLDLFITDLLSSRLLRNDGGTFTDRTQLLGLGGFVTGEDAVWADFDGDWNLDLCVSSTFGSARIFYGSTGDAAFTVGYLSSEESVGSVSAVDFDNDGDVDVFVGGSDPDQLFRNDGGTFVDVAADPLEADLTTSGVAWADYDGDGDLDAALSQPGSYRLVRNDVPTNNHWLHVELAGGLSNRLGVGARVRATLGGVSQTQFVTSGSGYLSNESLLVEFGLGAESVVNPLFIDWPSGISQVLHSVAADQRIVVHEGVTLDTPEGAFVDNDVAGVIEVQLVNVTEGGNTTISFLGTGPPLTANFELAAEPPLFYDVTTTAEFNSGAVVCIYYDETAVGDENSLRLLHYDSELPNWVDITTGLDTQVNRICGTTSNLSPFVLGRLSTTSAEAAQPRFALEQNAPNPFNPVTNIALAVPARGPVQLKVYNLRGQRVRTLVDEVLDAGHYDITFDGRDDSGAMLASGAYVYEMEAGGRREVRKLTLLK